MNTNFVFSFANDRWAFVLPVTLMTLDMLSGFIAAWSKGRVQSRVMRKGLAKKAGEIIGLLAAYALCFSGAMPMAVVYTASTYVSLMELLSVCENLNKLGVKIPDFVRKAMSKAEGGGEDK